MTNSMNPKDVEKFTHLESTLISFKEYVQKMEM